MTYPQDIVAQLTRIANALDRMSPQPAPAPPQTLAAYRWTGSQLSPSEHFNPLPIALLGGIDRQRDQLLENTRRLACGHAAHDILLWGARGSGKSALVTSGVAAIQAEGHALALVEIATTELPSLPRLISAIAALARPVVIFIDDLVFDRGVDTMRSLRSMLAGGANMRPAHVRFYITSNLRNIVKHDMSDQVNAINQRDVVDDHLALSERFGLSLGFHPCDQAMYLEIVSRYAARLGLPFDRADALLWATQRGSRSGRTAWHYSNEIAGRAGHVGVGDRLTR